MSDLLRIGGLAPQTSVQLPYRRPDVVPPATEYPIEGGDFPRFDAELQRVLAQSSFRVARTQAVREAIARGDYDSPERIRGAVDRLLDVLA